MGRISPKPKTSFTNLDVGDATNYTEIKDDGEINLHGTARVLRHIRVVAPSWSKGASAPADGLVGVHRTLDFDNSTDDEAYYELIVPYRMVAGSEIGVKVDWCYTGAQDNGTVCWGLEYLSVASGSLCTGATTSISGSSPPNQLVNRVIRTTFTTGITGATAHDSLGLRLYRDESEDTLGVDAKMIDVHFELLMDKLGLAT